MHRVESYAAGGWHRPTGEGRPLLDAATAEHKVHPFKLTFDDLEFGDSLTADSMVVIRADIAAYDVFTMAAHTPGTNGAPT